MTDVIVSNAGQIPDARDRDKYMTAREPRLLAYALGLHMLFAGLGKNRPQEEMDALTRAVAAELTQAGLSSVTPAVVSEALSRADKTVGAAVRAYEEDDGKVNFDATMINLLDTFPGIIEMIQTHPALFYEAFRRFGTMSLEASGYIPGTGPVNPGPVQDARDAISRGEHAKGIAVLRPLAEQGNVDAQLTLGIVYSNGDGVPQDHAMAMFWNRRAAELGDPRGQYQVGAMYLAGVGVPQDHAVGASWCRKAAEQGYFRAQFNLGVCFLKGEGVPQDHVQAHMWFSLSAAKGDSESVRAREIVTSKMTANQIAAAEKLAREWKAKK